MDWGSVGLRDRVEQKRLKICKLIDDGFHPGLATVLQNVTVIVIEKSDCNKIHVSVTYFIVIINGDSQNDFCVLCTHRDSFATNAWLVTTFFLL